MSRISPLNIVLTSVSLTLISVAAVFGAIAPGLDFGTLLERMLVNSWAGTDGTVKNADKVDGLHASDLLSAAWESNGTTVLIQEFAMTLGDNQASCPAWWVYLRTWPNYGWATVVCQKIYSNTVSGALFDSDGDGFPDLRGFAYTGGFNVNYVTRDVIWLDLDETSQDTSPQKSGVFLYLTSGSTIYSTRAAADTFCNTYKPPNKSLTNIRAFANFSLTDEIVDLPNNYGYNAYKPIFLINSGGLITNNFRDSSTPRTWSGLSLNTIPEPYMGGIWTWDGPDTYVWTAWNLRYDPGCGVNYTYAARIWPSYPTAGSYKDTCYGTGSTARFLCVAEVQN